jgi:hypothetical protein
MMYSAT